ncbi:MAG: hypothetical protein M0R66_05435 [Candidatus Omnitrophica bacterium]|nr:hypothetical protein [Candidatus Omnitrophota bacterium]
MSILDIISGESFRRIIDMLPRVTRDAFSWSDTQPDIREGTLMFPRVNDGGADDNALEIPFTAIITRTRAQRSRPMRIWYPSARSFALFAASRGLVDLYTIARRMHECECASEDHGQFFAYVIEVVVQFSAGDREPRFYCDARRAIFDSAMRDNIATARPYQRELNYELGLALALAAQSCDAWMFSRIADTMGLRDGSARRLRRCTCGNCGATEGDFGLENISLLANPLAVCAGTVGPAREIAVIMRELDDIARASTARERLPALGVIFISKAAVDAMRSGHVAIAEYLVAWLCDRLEPEERSRHILVAMHIAITYRFASVCAAIERAISPADAAQIIRDGYFRALSDRLRERMGASATISQRAAAILKLAVPNSRIGGEDDYKPCGAELVHPDNPVARRINAARAHARAMTILRACASDDNTPRASDERGTRAFVMKWLRACGK